MRWDRPKLTAAQILAWADDHHAHTGAWPRGHGDPVRGAPGEKWVNVNQAMKKGLRGLPGGDSLARLLARTSGVRNHMGLPRLSESRIVAWAREHRRRTGAWPTTTSGLIPSCAGETWERVAYAIQRGRRGLPGGDTLGRLLARRCGVPCLADRQPLAVGQILEWDDAHRERTGKWPTATSGKVEGVPETWKGIDAALRKSRRGLPGGSSLPLLLGEHRGRRDKSRLPPLTIRKVLAWADAHRGRTGNWPGVLSGGIAGAPGESWRAVNHALYRGYRGLPCGDSLAKLLVRKRGGSRGRENGATDLSTTAPIR